MKAYDSNVIHVIPPGGNTSVNFHYRSGVVSGTNLPITKLYEVTLECITGRFQVIAGWPGMGSPFSMTMNQGERQRFGWLLAPLAIDAGSSVNFTNLFETEESSAPGESTFKFEFVGESLAGSSSSP